MLLYKLLFSLRQMITNHPPPPKYFSEQCLQSRRNGIYLRVIADLNNEILSYVLLRFIIT